MIKTRRVLLVGLLAGVVAGIIGTRTASHTPLIIFFDNLHWTAATFGAAVLVWQGLLQAAPALRPLLRYLLIGFLLHALAECIWNLQSWAGWQPFPAPSDALYLALGPLMAMGLWRWGCPHLDEVGRRMVMLDTLTLLVAVSTVSLTLYIPQSGTYNVLQLMVIVAYPLGMMLPVALGTVLMLSLRIRPTLSNVGLLLATCVYALTWADWNLQALRGTQLPGSWLNLSFSITVLVIGLAASRLQLPLVKSARVDPIYNALLHSVPLLMVIAAAMGIILVQSQPDTNTLVHDVAVTGAIITMLLAMVRQSDMLNMHSTQLASERLLRERDAQVRQSQARLETLSQQQKALLDSAHYAIVSTDIHGVIRSLNPAMKHLSGFTDQELIGQSIKPLLRGDKKLAPNRTSTATPPMDSPAAFHTLVVLPSETDVQEHARHMVCKDGSVLPVMISVTPVRDRLGIVNGFMAIISDISARIIAEEALHEEELRYRTLIESAGDGILIWKDGLFTDCNSATLRLFGCERDQIIGHAPRELSPRMQPDGQTSEKKAQQRIADALRGEPQFFEWVHQQVDGTLFDAEVTLNRLEGDSTRFIAIVRDITERKKAERQLSEQKDLLQATLSAAPGLFLVFDAQGKISSWNAAFESTLEYSADEIRSLHVLDFCAPEDRSAAAEKIDSMLTLGDIENLELVLLTRSGRAIPVVASGSRAMLRGEPHVLTFAMDISIRKVMEKELQDFQAELIQRNNSLRLINLLSSRLSGLTRQEDITREAVDVIRMISHSTCTLFFLLHPEKPALTLAAANGLDDDEIERYAEIAVNNTMAGFVLRSGHVLRLDELPAAGAHQHLLNAFLARHGLKEGAFIPLQFNERPVGTIILFDEKEGFHQLLDDDTLEAIGRTVSLAIANARHLNDLEHQAHHDSLTRLPNRKVLHDTFDQLLNDAQPAAMALMLLDLNRFKEVNDTLGHHTGDILLVHTSQRLAHFADTASALVCRLGGDEFAILLHDIKSSGDAVEFAERISTVLHKPFLIDGKNLQVGASIGVALYPEHGKDSHALLRAADVAMYRAKQRVTDVVVYDRQSDTHSPERLSIISDLGEAIDKQQLVLHYQPKLALDNKTVTGFEALVRWQHPELGFLYPDAFIPVAEQGEAIHRLTQFVLDQALAQQQQWKAQGYRFSVAINLSARSLVDDRAIGLIRDLLDKYDTQPNELELEITETALMQDPDFAAQLLHRIARLGVRISIDDFGTGYSSLGYLRHLPISSLKIDRLFVKEMLQNEQDAIIVRSTIGLAHNLSMQVIAEGVEDAHICQALEEMGCDAAQGYYLSKPRAWHEIQRWLQDTYTDAQCRTPLTH